MKNNFYLALLLLFLGVLLSGCSMFGDNEPEYLASEEAEPLKIPEGLDTPAGLSVVTISTPNMRMPTGDELEPRPPRVVSTAGKHDTNAYMAWSAEGVYLLVKDTPDNVARKLRNIIESNGMTMLEPDDTGSHMFHYQQDMGTDEGFFSSMAFWRNDPFNYSGTFMTSLKADGKNTRIYLLFGTGEAVDTAGSEHVLGVFMERLG